MSKEKIEQFYNKSFAEIKDIEDYVNKRTERLQAENKKLNDRIDQAKKNILWGSYSVALEILEGQNNERVKNEMD